MVSWTFPIEYKYSPFDKSNESIESTEKFMGPYYNSDIFLSLANDMQQSNGKLDFSNGI